MLFLCLLPGFSKSFPIDSERIKHARFVFLIFSCLEPAALQSCVLLSDVFKISFQVQASGHVPFENSNYEATHLTHIIC